MDKMPEGTYVVSFSIETFNEDGTRENGVYGPIDPERIREWDFGPGEMLGESGDEWDFYSHKEVVEALRRGGITVGATICVNDPWPTDEGFITSTTYKTGE